MFLPSSEPQRQIVIDHLPIFSFKENTPHRDQQQQQHQEASSGFSLAVESSFWWFSFSFARWWFLITRQQVLYPRDQSRHLGPFPCLVQRTLRLKSLRWTASITKMRQKSTNEKRFASLATQWTSSHLLFHLPSFVYVRLTKEAPVWLLLFSSWITIFCTLLLGYLSRFLRDETHVHSGRSAGAFFVASHKMVHGRSCCLCLDCGTSSVFLLARFCFAQELNPLHRGWSSRSSVCLFSAKYHLVVVDSVHFGGAHETSECKHY